MRSDGSAGRTGPRTQRGGRSPDRPPSSLRLACRALDGTLRAVVHPVSTPAAPGSRRGFAEWTGVQIGLSRRSRSRAAGFCSNQSRSCSGVSWRKSGVSSSTSSSAVGSRLGLVVGLVAAPAGARARVPRPGRARGGSGRSAATRRRGRLDGRRRFAERVARIVVRARSGSSAGVDRRWLDGRGLHRRRLDGAGSTGGGSTGGGSTGGWLTGALDWPRSSAATGSSRAHGRLCAAREAGVGSTGAARRVYCALHRLKRLRLLRGRAHRGSSTASGSSPGGGGGAFITPDPGAGGGGSSPGGGRVDLAAARPSRPRRPPPRSATAPRRAGPRASASACLISSSLAPCRRFSSRCSRMASSSAPISGA